jgi:HD-like signal output (HDOD) protein
LVTEENNRYQTNHCLVGYILGEQWGLPPHLTNVIRTHHDLRNFSAPGQEMPDRTPLALHALLLLSEWVCGEVPNQEWSTMKPTLCTFLGLDESALARLRAAVPSFDD